MKITCPSCEIEYNLVSTEAKEEGIEPKFCPFCAYESTDELDFDEPDYTEAVDGETDDWDDWHPDDRF